MSTVVGPPIHAMLPRDNAQSDIDVMTPGGSQDISPPETYLKDEVCSPRYLHQYPLEFLILPHTKLGKRKVMRLQEMVPAAANVATLGLSVVSLRSQSNLPFLQAPHVD